MPEISGGNLPITVIKRIRGFSRYAIMVVQKSNIGHLTTFFRYKTLKLLRPYLASKGHKGLSFLPVINPLIWWCRGNGHESSEQRAKDEAAARQVGFHIHEFLFVQCVHSCVDFVLL
jgi:hypothetical protein